MTTVLTHAGTGIGIVEGIMKAFDTRLVQVRSPKEVFKQKKVDGIILLGGPDIDSYLYNQDPEKWTTWPNYLRDDTEIAMLRYADFHNIPVLGICRGLQIMTAFYGGDLIQDIIELKGHGHPYYHSIKVQGRMEGYVHTKWVNSLHHQAVNHVPSGFKVQARAVDGIIEAIWRPGRLGVQFHPELMYTVDQKWFNIFRWFLSGLK